MEPQNTVDNVSTSLAGILPESLQFLAGPLVALLTIVVGYFISKIISGLVASGINRTGFAQKAQSTGGNIGKSLAKAVFWVLWLFFILLGLSQFEAVADAIAPLTDMMHDIFGYLPKLIAGGIVFGIGVLLSRVVKEALTSTLQVAQVDSLAAKSGVLNVDGTGTSIASSLGNLARAIVLILFGITAIGILDIPNVSQPVGDMLQTVLDYIPSIIGATIILAIFVFIARFVSNLIKSTLPALGVDDSIRSITSLDGEDSPSFVPSNLIGTISFVGILLMGLTAAMRVLGIDELTNVFNTLLELGGRVVLGAVIIGAGVFIANFVSRIVTQTSGELAGRIIKYATLLIVTFMGLNATGLGDGIIDTAFSYFLGAGAVAAGVGGAIAFGMGGRDWAGKKLQEWFPAKSSRSTKK